MEMCRTNSKQCLVGVCTRCRVNPCGLDVFRRRVTLSFRNQKVVTNRFRKGRSRQRAGDEKTRWMLSRRVRVRFLRDQESHSSFKHLYVR